MGRLSYPGSPVVSEAVPKLYDAEKKKTTSKITAPPAIHVRHGKRTGPHVCVGVCACVCMCLLASTLCAGGGWLFTFSGAHGMS